MSYWYDDAIFYNLYPLGAVNAKHRNDYVQTTEGMERLGDWIPHIANMGCNALYLGPVFESVTHGYDTTDYRKLDSRLGTNAQLAAFVKSCHAAGVKVVLDGVFNHTGRDFFAFRDLREKRDGSQYKDWYQGVSFGGNTPMNDGFSYEAWRGHFELPRLNPHNPAVREHLFDAVRLWIREFDIDGIRLDCADCLDFGFMKELRLVTTGIKPDFWLMGEIIHGDYNRWANPETLHSVTNYECQKGLYSSHNDGNMHEIAYSLRRQFGEGGIYRGKLLYAFADNHDLNRLADTVKEQSFLPTIYTLLFTMPGLPSLYYGSEWGLRGVTDRVTDWALRPEIDIRTVTFDNPALMEHIAFLAKLRAGSEALRHGEYVQLAVTAKQLAFRRGNAAIALVNCDGAPAGVQLDIGGEWRDCFSGQTFAGGRVTVTIPAHGSMILVPAAETMTAAPPALHEQTAPPPVPAPQPVAQPAPVQPAAPPVPASVPQDGGGITIANVNSAAMTRVEKHPVFEHKKSVLAESGRVKVTVYELAPGKSAYPYHWHTAEEEVFYILGGKGLLRTPDGERNVAAGDLIHFPAGKSGAHRLINNHHEPLRYIGFDALADGDVAVMPDSNKVNLMNGEIYRLGEKADYYAGE